MPHIHIHHVTAVTMDAEDRVLRDAAIVTAGERIVYVGPMAEAPAAKDGDTVIDGAGMVAIPGLINTHTHLAMTLFRGAADDLPLMTWLQEKIWPVEAHLTAEDVYWASLLGIAEMLRAGVTTFCDMYWHVEAVARAVRESGIRAHLSGVVIGVAPNGAELLAKAVERVRAFRDEGHPRLTPMFGPHAPYTVPAAMLRQVVERASELGVGIHTHLSETEAEVAESLRQHGRAPIAYMDHVGLFSVPITAAHCVHPRPEEMPLLAERGVGVAHCPGSNMKLGSGIAPVSAYLDAGVTVGLGTDGAGSNNTLDLLRAAHLAALLAKVGGDPTALPAGQALALATRDGARALHRDDLGVLAPGTLADIALLDFTAPHLAPTEGREISHLVYAARGADVETVIVHGRVLLRGRRLLALDEARIRARVRESAQRLFGGAA
ncbi:MAG TPA: amidohydrolase [Armatimonadota bacterium]|nr:amidohydrolase [Armatimonadota bacterium]HOS42392.1 amidohydrolase [Armatimonadota bacterium]